MRRYERCSRSPTLQPVSGEALASISTEGNWDEVGTENLRSRFYSGVGKGPSKPLIALVRFTRNGLADADIAGSSRRGAFEHRVRRSRLKTLGEAYRTDDLAISVSEQGRGKRILSLTRLSVPPTFRCGLPRSAKRCKAQGLAPANSAGLRRDRMAGRGVPWFRPV